MAGDKKGTGNGPRPDPIEGIDLPRFYTVKEVALRFRCHPRTIRDWINHGCPANGRLVKLPAGRLGKKWQVREDWLVLFEHRVRPQGGRPDLDVE